MNKSEFLEKLRKKISSLPESDVKRSLEYYAEMIDDSVEDGLSEGEAVASLGNPDDIAVQILSESSRSENEKQKSKKRRALRAWEIVLIALGSPLWLSLAAAAFSVLVAIYASLLSVVISLWAVFGAFVGSALGVTAAGIVFVCLGKAAQGIAAIGVGVACMGLSVFAFFGAKAATVGTLLLTKKTAVGIKKCFAKKEEV